MSTLRKYDILIFRGSDPLPPKGGTSENQRIKKSPLAPMAIGVRGQTTYRS
jgi:hypothetical protein